MIGNLFDLFRVLAAFVAVFIALPYAVHARAGNSRLRRAAEGLASTVLFAQLTGLILGGFGFCLHGSVAAAYTGFIAVSFLTAGKGRFLAQRHWWQRQWFRALQRIEGNCGRVSRRRFRLPLEWFPKAATLLLLIAILTAAAWYPIANVRFQNIESYSRALSLEVLVRGQVWQPDGSVAFLAPVVFLSGLHGDAVVRHGNVVLVLLLTLAAGYAALRHTRSETAAILAMTAAAGCVLGLRGTPEMSAAEIAAIFWLFAIGFIGQSRWHCFVSASIALLVSLTPSWRSVLLLALVATIIVWTRILARGASRTPRFSRVAALILIGWLIYQPASGASPNGPYQYESAARAVKRIAAEFPPNDWLIVSPVHEIALLYGRGWHEELMDFVKVFTPQQASDPAFRFPYQPKDIFVFVEKVPLAASGATDARLGLMQDLDISVLTYQSILGRGALQFQAGRLMEAYASSHPGTSVYFEDEQLLVYHLR